MGACALRTLHARLHAVVHMLHHMSCMSCGSNHAYLAVFAMGFKHIVGRAGLGQASDKLPASLRPGRCTTALCGPLTRRPRNW